MTRSKSMAHSKSKIVRILEPKGQSALSKAQKLFNKLIKKIDEQRKALAEWQTAIPRYQQRYANDFDPLLQTFDQHRVKLVHLFDRAYIDKALTKTDKAKIKDIICPIAAELIANGNEDLKSIYNKYSETDFDAEADEANEAIKFMMEDMLGVELGEDVDFSSPEKMFEHVGEQMRQKQAEEEKYQQEYEERRSKRKKSAKELAKEARQQAEEQHVSQSIREVFRKLASALHPDREQDPVERTRKTALMQRVNVAYGNKDLLQLLELQLEVEQIDQTTINAISEDRLKHYNKVLAEQSSELQQEIDEVGFSFRARFNFAPSGSLSPMTAMHQLQADIKHIQDDIAMLERDLASFQNIKNLKAWLKTYRISRQSSFEAEMFGAMDLDALFKSK
jgi:hypothetical protein